MNIRAKLTEKVRVRRLTARTASGDQTRGEALTFQARIERGAGRVTAKMTGSEYDATTLVWTIEEVLLSDLLYFPEDTTTDVDTGRKPTKVEKMIGTNGKFSHYEVTI
jgi:hypothetical protein